jgi:hypothetical protein
MRRNGVLAKDYARRHGVARCYPNSAALIADPRSTPFISRRFLIPTLIGKNAENLKMVRVRGIEPRFQAWEAHVIAVILHPHRGVK